jgi:hypothetical protein
MPTEPTGNGYGAPLTELIIWQMDPPVARGMPAAVAALCVIAVIIPVSGGPAAPGLNTTLHPIVTGLPGISLLQYQHQ